MGEGGECGEFDAEGGVEGEGKWVEGGGDGGC